MKYRRTLATVFTVLFLSTSGFAAAQSLKWDLDSAFGALVESAGTDEEALQYLRDRVTAAQTTFTLKRDLESRFLAIVQRTDVSPAARDFALTQLNRVASEQSVHVLEPLLYDASTSELARKVLEHVPVNTATDVLVKAMQNTSGDIQEGIVYSLGARQDPRSVKPITKFSGRGDPDVVRAAIWALGEIGGPDAEKDLIWCRGNTLRQHRDFAAETLLRVAERYVETGDTKAGVSLYELLALPVEPPAIRARAVEALLHLDQETAIQTILDVLMNEIPEVRQAAMRAVRDLPGREVTRRCAEALYVLPDDKKIELAGALGDRGDPDALPAIHKMLDSGNASVRHAAIAALGKLGDHMSVSELLELLIRPGVDDSEQIRQALATMNGPGVDDEIVEEIYGPNELVRSVLIDTLIARGTPNATTALIRVARQSTGNIQLQALDALSQVASVEAIPVLVDFMLTAPNTESGAAARQAILAALQRGGDATGDAAGLVAALDRKDLSIAAKNEVIELVVLSKDDAAVPALAAIADKDKTELSLACLDALGDWPTNAALQPMADIARSMRKEPKRTAWVQSYLDLLSRFGTAASIDHFKAVAEAVESPEEKRALLETLDAAGVSDASSVAQKFLDDPDVGPMASDIVNGTVRVGTE